MMELADVHESLQRRLQLIERKISLQGIQLGQVLDYLHRASNKDANKNYFEELNANTIAQHGESTDAERFGVIKTCG